MIDLAYNTDTSNIYYKNEQLSNTSFNDIDKLFRYKSNFIKKKPNLFLYENYQSSYEYFFIQNVIKERITHKIKEEKFIIEFENELCYLSHPKWSLVGMGNNLCEAEIDLIKEAKIIAPNFINVPINSLNNEALRLRDFLFKLIY